MIRRPPRSTRTDTLFPYPTLFRSYAKTRLAEADSGLHAALDVGLSGPSRLHDLFVTHEAVTPGEFKRRGEGLTIRWGWQPSPFGDCLLLHTDRGLCGMAFAYATTATTTGGEDGRAAAFADMAGRWPRALLVDDPAGP